MTSYYNEANPYVDKIKEIFQKEEIPIPVGFTSQDVNKDVPKLFDNGFDSMFFRMVKEISMGMHTLNLTMTYREDMMLLFMDLTSLTQKYYDYCTKYLLKKGLLP